VFVEVDAAGGRKHARRHEQARPSALTPTLSRREREAAGDSRRERESDGALHGSATAMPTDAPSGVTATVGATGAPATYITAAPASAATPSPSETRARFCIVAPSSARPGETEPGARVSSVSCPCAESALE